VEAARTLFIVEEEVVAVLGGAPRPAGESDEDLASRCELGRLHFVGYSPGLVTIKKEPVCTAAPKIEDRCRNTAALGNCLNIYFLHLKSPVVEWV
jgi:hypothetical protein